MAMLLGDIDPKADAAVRETWRATFGGDFDTRWKQALHDGFVQGAAAAVTVNVPDAKRAAAATSGEGLDIVFRPDPTIWDGQFANVGWLQELPKPLTTLTWGNVIAVSPALAKRIGASNGDHVEATVGDRRVVGPAWIMPGQADNTIALYLGYGRKRAGRVGDGLGYDAYDVQPADQPWLAKGSLRKVEELRDAGGHAAASPHGRVRFRARGLLPSIRRCPNLRRSEASIPSGIRRKPPGAW